ncbi:hypothetical protein Bca101_094905 [Brassica carinata]
MDDRVVVVDVLACLSFVLRGRYDYGCGLWLKDMVEGHGCGWMIVVVAKGLRLGATLSFVLRGRHDYGCVDDMIMVVVGEVSWMTGLWGYFEANVRMDVCDMYETLAPQRGETGNQRDKGLGRFDLDRNAKELLGRQAEGETMIW